MEEEIENLRMNNAASTCNIIKDESVEKLEDKITTEMLLEKISHLEKENDLLKKERKESNKYKIDATDVYLNLKKLQNTLKEKIASNYEALELFKDETIRHGYDRLEDLQPWIESAAKSRNIDIEFIKEGLPVKKRQFVACVIMFSLLPLSFLFTLFCIYLSFYDKTRVLGALLLIYMIHIYTDKSFESGSYSNKWLKQHYFWKYLASYFPILLVKQNPETEYDPTGVYMFGYHPHGVISVGCFVNFACDANGASEMFPGIKIHPATLAQNFFIPFWRELLLRLGVISVSAESLKYVLKSGPGNAALIVPGGAAEALDAHPGKHNLTLNRRQGFFRIALQHGASLVPIYSFGENDLYEQVQNEEGSIIRKIQNKMLSVMGIAMPFFSGAGGSSSSMPMNPIPKRSPVVTVVGDPIKCPLIENPTTEDINNARILYVEKLQEIFNEFADKYAPERKSNLEIVK